MKKLAGIVLATAMLSGCFHDDESKAKPAPAVLTAIAINPSMGSVEIGDIALFTATGIYSDGSTAPVNAWWTSLDQGIASEGWVMPYQPGAFYALSLGTATIRATAASDPSIVATAPLDVVLKPAPQPTITTTVVGAAQQGSPFSFPLAYANGAGAPLWQVESGALPPGLTLDPATGVISGTTNGLEVYFFTVRVTDAAGTDTQDLLLSVYGPPVEPH